MTLLSFGFKYGIPEDSDLVFDVRFLPNPYYIPTLKPLTGNDPAVYDYVMAAPQAKEFQRQLFEMVKFLIPNYIAEGKNQIVISIGCTGEAPVCFDGACPGITDEIFAIYGQDGTSRY